MTQPNREVVTVSFNTNSDQVEFSNGDAVFSCYSKGVLEDRVLKMAHE